MKAREPAADKRTNPEIGKRFLAQMGSFASPERVDTALRRREQGVKAFVRYKLPKAALNRVVAEYKDTHRFQGMELGQLFPAPRRTPPLGVQESSCSQSTRAPRRTSSACAQANSCASTSGAPSPSIDALKTQLGDESARAQPGSAILTLEIESAGAKRPVRFDEAVAVRPRCAPSATPGWIAPSPRGGGCAACGWRALPRRG